MTPENPISHDSIHSSELVKLPAISFGEYLPNRILTNDEIESWNVKTASGKLLTAVDIQSKTGISKRYVANEKETPLFMAEMAAQEALKQNNRRIDAVIVSTSFPTGKNLSAELKKEFSIEGYNLDVYAACSGFGLSLAHLKENEKKFSGKNILLVATEKYSPFLWDLRQDGMRKDPSMAQTIFSDGATAMVFEYGKDLTVQSVEKTIFSNKIENESIKMPIDKKLLRSPFLAIYIPRSKSGKFEQDGASVYKIMRNAIPELIKKMKSKAVSSQQVQMIIPHQGSRHMVDSISQQLNDGFPPIIKDIEEGNFSSASIPRTLNKVIREGKIKKGRLFLVGFGAGLFAVGIDAMLG